MDLGAVDPQDLNDRKPKVGEVLITRRKHFNIYSLIIKQNHFEDVNEECVKVAIHNLRIALEFRSIAFQNMETLAIHYQKVNYANYYLRNSLTLK